MKYLICLFNFLILTVLIHNPCFSYPTEIMAEGVSLASKHTSREIHDLSNYSYGDLYNKDEYKVVKKGQKSYSKMLRNMNSSPETGESLEIRKIFKLKFNQMEPHIVNRNNSVSQHSARQEINTSHEVHIAIPGFMSLDI